MQTSTPANGRAAPSAPERARTVVAQASTATLSTFTREPVGYPFGSLVSFSTDDAGRPTLILSRRDDHAQNLLARPEASLLVVAPHDSDRDPLARLRVTLVGRCRASSAEGDRDAADLALFRLDPIAILFAAGGEAASSLDLEAYHRAEIDPLAASASSIVAHMNDDHADAVLAIARATWGRQPRGGERTERAVKARMTAIDRHGFEIEVATAAGTRPLRVGFPAECGGRDGVTTTEGVRGALIVMVKKARGQLALERADR